MLEECVPREGLGQQISGEVASIVVYDCSRAICLVVPHHSKARAHPLRVPGHAGAARCVKGGARIRMRECRPGRAAAQLLEEDARTGDRLQAAHDLVQLRDARGFSIEMIADRYLKGVPGEDPVTQISTEEDPERKEDRSRPVT